jgi:3,4-dihydroxy-2-butanone 4-phosphate synthase/GTP cyclohydrolase II
MKQMTHSWTLRRIACAQLPTKWGVFQALGFEREFCNGARHTETAVALVTGDVTGGAPLLRIHSECLTGDVFGSLRCDCGKQLEMAMHAIAREACGILIYEHQEGRGIGLMAKLQAYSLQDAGLDTLEANHALGLPADCRNFGLPAAILHELGIGRVRLLSNNPEKSRALEMAGIEVAEQIPCEAPANPYSIAYLRTKKEKFGHLLRLGSREDERVRDDQVDYGFPNDEISAPVVGHESPFASIDLAIQELRAGRVIVVVDDEDRENEGDLLVAAEMVTPEVISFMATHGRGLICLALTGQRLDELEIGAMVSKNGALGGTGFTVSIDAKGWGVTTGISARDRSETIRAAIDARSLPEDFARPGHVFPLRPRPGGVLERRGHTEAAVDLSRIANLHPSGVICEILNDDGTMARRPDLIRFCHRHGLKMITIADLVECRLKRERVASREPIRRQLPVPAEDSEQPSRNYACRIASVSGDPLPNPRE